MLYDKLLHRKALPAGQAQCESCGKIVLDWTVTTVMIDGQFFDVCRPCKAKVKEPICVKIQTK